MLRVAALEVAVNFVVTIEIRLQTADRFGLQEQTNALSSCRLCRREAFAFALSYLLMIKDSACTPGSRVSTGDETSLSRRRATSRSVLTPSAISPTATVKFNLYDAHAASSLEPREVYSVPVLAGNPEYGRKDIECSFFSPSSRFAALL